MTEEDIEIENRLKELRRERQLSQEDLAGALGISRQSVIALEQGRFLPSLPLAISMCRFFDLAFEEIFQIEREIGEEIDRAFEEDNSIRIKVVNTHNPEVVSGKEREMSNELEPWRPFREAISLRDAVDRLLSDSVITPRMPAMAMPKIDIKERNEDILVRAELPGIKEEEVDIEVSSDGFVTISGQKAQEKEEKEEGYHYKESYSGSFSRSFSLPTEVVADRAVADMENGVLTLIIPKARPEKVQKLKIAPKKK